MIYIRPNPEFFSKNDEATVPELNDDKSPKSPSSSPFTKKKTVLVDKTPLHRDETSDKTSLSFDVAGFTSDQLKVEIFDHVLTVSAERQNKLGDTFSVRRRFALDADKYDEESVTANLGEDGVLELIILKKPEPKARQIRVLHRAAPASKRVVPETITAPAPPVSSASVSNNATRSTSEPVTTRKVTTSSNNEEHNYLWNEIVRECLKEEVADVLISQKNASA